MATKFIGSLRPSRGGGEEEGAEQGGAPGCDAPHCGSLPHGKGVVKAPAGSGDGSSDKGNEASQADTDETSSSVRRLAMICIQSGAMAVRVP